MEKRRYPAERKPGPVWQCPICNSTMSSRGRPGHLEKVHGRGKPIKEHDPFPEIKRILGPKNRPLSRSDVRNLISNVFYLLIRATRDVNIVEIRRAMFQCEYLIKELEINGSCSLEEAWAKFRIMREEIDVFRNTNKEQNKS